MLGSEAMDILAWLSAGFTWAEWSVQPPISSENHVNTGSSLFSGESYQMHHGAQLQLQVLLPSVERWSQHFTSDCYIFFPLEQWCFCKEYKWTACQPFPSVHEFWGWWLLLKSTQNHYTLLPLPKFQIGSSAFLLPLHLSTFPTQMLVF